MSASTSPQPPQIRALQNFSACDISDALLKLKVPNCGFLPDLKLHTPTPGIINPNAANRIIIAPASTVQFIPRDATDLSAYPKGNVPNGKHWVDLIVPDTFVVISQPKGQICAVIGGIMALRMKVIGAQGVIAYGRIRDLDELRATELPIWAMATSITGTGAEAKPHALQKPLDLDGTIVNPGDLVFSDPVNGIVIIPKDKVDDVLDMLPRMIEADDCVKEDVLNGMSVNDAFKKWRG
ncbi:ribonuclease E inhibitor RraA/Dimethylmenaquinone methyltransferase [Calycina marina]|uniref:Ribonuclease E inhibitor RraA/Dimethylmenaquinone methyltransferase n=1 Tax=Calycina marina TaxID=1763456 RepID=A0A9P8CBS0_9HELO|nr:ribonuclease E inhibitor RraA/Dimethylmenaquinone methyltransferase [Calycina marina]